MSTPLERLRHHVTGAIERGEAQNGYVAFFNGKRIEVYADNLYQAKLKAIDQFKAPKSKQHMVSVMLAEKNGETVTHTADF